MTYTTDRVTVTYTPAVSEVVPATLSAFTALSTDDQLGLLWVIYTELGKSITPAAPGAARLTLVEGLLNQFKAMTYTQQLQAMRDLVERRNTAITRSYGVFSPNTKLGFWYLLAEAMGSTIVPVPEGYQLSAAANQVLEQIKDLDFGQQITLLRKVVIDMGVDVLRVYA